jgi:[ribosomal protein S18]-alanine N-acetyltransferase
VEKRMGDVTADQTRILAMVESDLDEIVRIEALSGLTSWSRQSFLGELKNPLSFCFCLKREKERTCLVLGFICLRIVREDSELLNLGIDPQCRQKGWGRHLMRFYIDFCHERKVKIYHLETGVSNEPAIRLYESFAYRRTGIRPKFYGGRQDALLMMRRA